MLLINCCYEVAQRPASGSQRIVENGVQYNGYQTTIKDAGKVLSAIDNGLGTAPRRAFVF
jgi:hypothetical protein